LEQKRVSQKWKAILSERYRTIDINNCNSDINATIADLSYFRENSADIVIASHVLEHVKDVSKTVRDFLRILRHGSELIALAPIDLSLKRPVESDKEGTDIERWEHFTHSDHFRIYTATDFPN
jgi:predicted SAM-dependent methyltransferase